VPRPIPTVEQDAARLLEFARRRAANGDERLTIGATRSAPALTGASAARRRAAVAYLEKHGLLEPVAGGHGRAGAVWKPVASQAARHD
jgi:hypothetical protein